MRSDLVTSGLIGLLAGLAGCRAADNATPHPAVAAEAPLYSDTFQANTGQWIVEQVAGGSVTIGDGAMVINDVGGCTVWFRERLQAPVRIVCELTVSSAGRVSDMNFFWMATDPARPGYLFGDGHSRNGTFASYDSLRTYYAGYGGNTNTTTRFRRYDGTGGRPLLPEHDLSAPEYLLKPDHLYRIELIVRVDGRVQFLRDGAIVFDWNDPAPLTSGWFGFRTVHSRIVVKAFAVHTAKY